MRAGTWLASATVLLATGYAAWSVSQLAALPAGALALNALLLAVELTLLLFAALLLATIGTARLPAAGLAPRGDVDLLIPVRDEDPDVLRATLQAALALDARSRAIRVVVVDDSSEERRPRVAEVCRALGVRYVARDERRGYKAGALNDALRSTGAPFVAVLDVDHQPGPAFVEDALARMAPGVAYVQSVVEWRNADSLLRRLAATLQRQFYHGVQVDKGQREHAVFAGSAAVFRREALDDVGGFPEATLVEDFDLTLRLAAAGWKGRLAPVVGARGLLPWTARDLARQLWRWSRGTTEVVLRQGSRALLRGKGAFSARAELVVDGLAYLAGGAFILALATLMALAALDLPLARPLGGWTLLLAPLAVAGAHVASAAQAMRRSGHSEPAILPLYHVVSLAFTPVLFASSLAALFGLGGRMEGRVTKTRSTGTGLSAAVVLTVAVAVLAIALASLGSLPLAASGWVLFLGLCFGATVVVLLPPLDPARNG